MNPARIRNDISFTAAANLAKYKMDEMKIVTSVWTQPHWMKENSQVCNGNFSHGGWLPWTNEAREQNARYLAAAIKAIQDRYNISIYGISPQNELGMVHSCASWTTSSQKFSSQEDKGPGYNTWIPETKRLHIELKNEGMGNIKIMGPEEMTIGNEDDIWQTWFQMRHVKDIYRDSKMMDVFDIWCHHDYNRDGASPDPANRKVQDWVWTGHKDQSEPALNWDGYADHKRPVCMTEGKTAGNDWDSAMEFGNYMQDAIVAGNVSAYVPWSLGSESTGDEHAITTYSGGINKYYRVPTYVFKHFSRYIRPGAIRLSATPDNPKKVTVSAFKHDTNQTQTIVLINNGSGSSMVNITVPSNPAVKSFLVFTSRSGSYWKKGNAPVVGKVVSVNVPAKGMATLYGKGDKE